jgi:hypothetical protein
MAERSGRHKTGRSQARSRTAASRPTGSVAATTDVAIAEEPAHGNERRRAATTCGWCGTAMEPKAQGRIPKWCSASCRQRAWEQARAAKSGRLAVEVVERRVETPVPMPPTRRDWPRLLDELAHQIDDGRVYDRDLDGLSSALTAVLDAVGRRPYVRSRTTGLR